MYNLKFVDGTIISGLMWTEGFNWYSKMPIDSNILRESNITRVEVSGDEQYVLLNQKNDFLDEYDGGYSFNLRDATPLELVQKEQRYVIGGQRVDRPYKVGEYLTANGKLYRVILPILTGATITPGTNVEETDIATELSKLTLGGN